MFWFNLLTIHGLKEKQQQYNRAEARSLVSGFKPLLESRVMAVSALPATPLVLYTLITKMQTTVSKSNAVKYSLKSSCLWIVNSGPMRLMTVAARLALPSHVHLW